MHKSACKWRASENRSNRASSRNRKYGNRSYQRLWSKNGAVATTVGHDSHNIIVVGDNDSDMLLAVEELKRIKGGYTVISNGKVIESLPLIFGGLMSVLPTDEFISQLDKTISAARNLGVNKNIDPFITLSFMALPVIPEIRITDMGIFEM